MTALERPRFAPGCFGSALGYAEDRICAACPFAEDCKPRHLAAKEDLRKYFNVTARAPRPALPKKAEELMKKFGKSATEVREALLAGRNPYPLTKGYMGLVCHFIMVAPRELTIEDISKLLSVKLKLAESSSRTYALLATSILRHCDVFTDESGLVLRKG